MSAFWDDVREAVNDPEWLAAYLEACDLIDHADLHDLEDVAAELGIDLDT